MKKTIVLIDLMFLYNNPPHFGICYKMSHSASIMNTEWNLVTAVTITTEQLHFWNSEIVFYTDSNPGSA